LLVWILAVMLTTASNIVSDPVMSSIGSFGWLNQAASKPEWIWRVAQGDSLFEGVPISNFVGWAVVSLFFFGAAIVVIPNFLRKQNDPIAALMVSFCTAVFYLVRETRECVVVVLKSERFILHILSRSELLLLVCWCYLRGLLLRK
jgi:uncharacterized membrane protein